MREKLTVPISTYRYSGNANEVSTVQIDLSGFCPSFSADANVLAVCLFVWSGGQWIKYNPWYATAPT